jgi:plastocyanin
LPTPEPAPTQPQAPATVAVVSPTRVPAPPQPSGIAAPIRGYGFPYELRVSAGATVVWTNYDDVAHDVTASDGSWGSTALAKGQSFARTFAQPGRYAYVCKLHPYMAAVLIVE